MMKLKMIAALICALCSVSVAVAQDTPAKSAGGAPKLFVESFIHDFGEVNAGTPLRYTFKVRNEGSSDLLIQNVQPG